MATIPRVVAQHSLDPGGVVQFPTGDPVGQALEQGANKAQQLVTHYQDRVHQQERFQSLIQFDEFGSQLIGETDKAKAEMKPGAMGLHDKLIETYDKRSTEWLATIPESQRPEFAARIKAKRESFSIGAARLEKDESDRFQTVGIETRLGTAKQGILQSGPQAIGTFQKDVDELIDSSTLTPIQKEEAKRKVRADLQETGFRALATQDPEAALNVAKGWGVDKGFSGSAVDRTMQLLRDKEGFKSSTYWDVNAHRVGFGSDTITTADGKVRPVKQGDTVSRDDAERDLKRRTNESLASVQSAVGAEAFAKLNPNQQASLGSVTYNYGKLPDSVAAAVRTGDAEAIARSIEALQGHNDGVNRDRRLSEAALARSTGDGPAAGVYSPDPRFKDVPADRRLVLAGAADLEARRRQAADMALQTQAYNERLNALQTDVIDGRATLADVQKARQDGWLKDAGDILRVTGQIAARDKGLADTQAFGRAMTDPAFPWNPVDKDQKDIVDAGFKSLGGNMQALQTIAEKTGIVPASAAVVLRGALFSPDAKRVEGALQTAAKLIGGKYPDIFAGADGGKDLTEVGHTFREYVYGRGMTAAEATKKIMEERTPEFEQKVKAKIKKEDLDQIVKKELSDGDIRKAFDEWPWFVPGTKPALTFNPEMRQRAMGDYEASFRDNFLRNGDTALSKTLAQQEMKRTWGVTSINGSGTVMKFPPERSPAYAGIENPGDLIASQAIAAIKELNGVDVDGSKIQLDEVKSTAERFVRGEPPTYVLSYTDKNGHVQVIPKQFFADPAAMRAEQTVKRAVASGRIQERVAIDADMSDLTRANFGVGN